jgi:hypothetical protein
MDSMTGKKEAEETYTFETSQHVIISVAPYRELRHCSCLQKKKWSVAPNPVSVSDY